MFIFRCNANIAKAVISNKYFVSGGWIITSIAVPFALHVYHKWPATMLLPPPQGGDDDFEDKNYLVPWCRFSPYVAGVVLGYILHKTKNKKMKITKVKQAI